MLFYQRLSRSGLDMPSSSHLYGHEAMHHPTPSAALSALSNPPSVPSSPIGSPRPSTASSHAAAPSHGVKDPLGNSRTQTPDATEDDLHPRYPPSTLSTPQSLRIHTGHTLSPFHSPSPATSPSVRVRAQQLWLRSFPSLPPPSALPSALVSGIWKANVEFLQDKHIFDFSFLSFCFHLCTRQTQPAKGADAAAGGALVRPELNGSSGSGKGKPSVDVQLAQVATLFVFRVLVRSAENGSFYQWMELLRSMYRSSAASRRWLLQHLVQEADFTQQLMFLCPHAVVRDAFCDLLFLVVNAQAAADLHDAVAQRQLSRRLRAELPKDAAVAVLDGAPDGQAPSETRSSTHPALTTVAALLALLLSWLPYVPSQARSSAAYFRLLLRLAQRRPSVRRWLTREGAISLLLHFYCTTQPILHFNYRGHAGATGQCGPARDDAAPGPGRQFHPYRGHLALSVMAVLVASAMRRKGPGKPRTRSVKEALRGHDRQLLLQGLLPDEDDGRQGAKDVKDAKDAKERREVKEAKEDVREEKTHPSTLPRDDEKGSLEEKQPTPPSAEKPLSTVVLAGSPPTAAPSPLSSASASPSGSLTSSSSFSAAAVGPSSPALSSATFPFFPFVLSDSSCLSVVCSLVQVLAVEDVAISRALMDAIFELLHELVNGHSTRVLHGIAVHHQPLQNEPPSFAAQSAGAAASSSLCRVPDFLTVLGAFSTLLSLSDSLTNARVDLGLTRLFALVRRVLARRHAATMNASAIAAAGPGGVSAAVNGVEERFLLVAVRCILRLSVTSRPVALWLKGHDKDWLAWESVYSSSRHLMSHHIK